MLALAGLVLLLGVVALWLHESQRPVTVATPAVSQPTSPPTPVATTDLSAAPSSTQELRAPASPVPVQPDDAPPVADPKPVSPTRGPSLAGTLVVVEAGAEHRAEDGKFALVLWSGNSGAWHDVEVRGGRWSTELPVNPEGLSVNGVVLGGRGAVCDHADERLRLPANGWLDLRARWPSPSILRVQDRASGRDLAPVLLTEVQGWPESDLGHPGSAAQKERDLGPSPVTLPARAGRKGLRMRTCYARSPGYAWARIEIDETRGGERILFLDPSGTLEIELLGRVSDPGTKLRVFASAYAPVVDQSARQTGTLTFADLAAGRYRVKAEIGDYWDSPLVLAEAEAEVVAGGRARVVLALKELDASVEVPLEGTLLLPDEWALDEYALDFELLDTPRGGGDGRFSLERGAMQPVGGSPGLYRWTAPAAQPGRYDVELRALGWHAVITVPLEGMRDARVVVPPPCEVLVRCLDHETGAEVTSEQVTWYCAMPEGIKGWSNEDATWDEVLGRYRIRCPQGEIVIRGGGGKTYAYSEETIQVHAGENSAVLRLEHSTSLKVLLRDSDVEIPWDDEHYPTLEPAEGQAGLHSWSSGGGQITLHQKEPGRYLLKVPVIPGYRLVPDTEVRLEKGKVIEHVVQLVRER